MIQFSKYCMLSIALLVASCSNKDTNIVRITELPESIQLAGTPVYISSEEPLIVGNIESIGDRLILYLYNNENFLASVDSQFGDVIYFAHKGDGPGELSGISGKYNMRSSKYGEYLLFDPYKKKIFSYTQSDGYNLSLICDFKEFKVKYYPQKILLLKDGNIVSPLQNTYGLQMYDKEQEKIIDWPLGYEFDKKRPIEEHIVLRAFDYDPILGLVGEIYGSFPSLILHNEGGGVELRIDFPIFKAIKKEEGDLSEVFKDIQMTDKYIYLLYGDEEIEEFNKVIQLSYEGVIVKVMDIYPASTILVEEDKNRIFGVNPNEEEYNVVEYNMPT